jgi:transposase
MSQGKQWNQDEVISILEPYFKLGCNVAKACAYAGISRTTVQTWIENDEALRLKVNAWQNEMSTQARKNFKKLLDEANPQSTLEWLKRKEKDEFSERTEQTGANGEPIVVKTVAYGDNPSTSLRT